MPIFEWDENKEKENLRKHKISFAEAETVFYDPHTITIPDPDHSVSSSGLSTSVHRIKIAF